MPGRRPATSVTCIAILSLTLVPLRSRASRTSSLLGLAAKQVQMKEFSAAQRTLRMVLAKDPQSAEAYNLLGVCEASLGDYASAHIAFQRSVRLDSHFPAAHENLGRLMLAMHNERAALKQFEAALAVDPNALTEDSQSYQGFNLLGLCLMDEQKYRAASSAFAHSLRINPHYAPAQANLGLALVALKRDSEALLAFVSALKLRPQDPVVISNVGLIYARKRKFARAAEYLRKAHMLAPNDANVTAALAAADIESGRSGEAEQLTNNLAAKGRLTPPMRASLAASWFQKDKAERAFQLVKANPELAARFYRLGYDKAQALFEENQPLAAVHLLEAMRELRSPDSAYYALLGSVYYSLGSPKQASYSFQQAIHLDPSNTEDYFKLGMVFLKYHTYQPAIYIFQTALQSKPKSAKLWFGLGMSDYFASNITNGEQALRKAISLAPDYAVAYIVLGDLLRQTGRLHEAALTFKRAIHLQPDSFVPYYYFGVVSSALGAGTLNPAISALRKAVLLNPNFADARYELGKSLAEQGKTSQAITELRKSLVLDPGLAKSHYQLGRIYEKMGETALAREQFRLFAATTEKQHSHDLIRSLVVQIGKPQK
jgi:tetratricopeptide (TPR) repeat protein